MTGGCSCALRALATWSCPCFILRRGAGCPSGNSMVAQGQWGPDNATALESSRAPAGPTAPAGQRAEGFCTVRGSNHTSPLRGSRVVQGYIQTVSLPLRTKGFCILFKESSFCRVKGHTPRTEGAEDWQRPALTHQAEMQGSTDKAQSVL